MKGIHPGNHEELQAQLQGEEPNEQQILPLVTGSHFGRQ